jgi:hypothetical protein
MTPDLWDQIVNTVAIGALACLAITALACIYAWRSGR